jgi:hypothetical protein
MIEETTPAVKKLHAEGLCNSEWEQIEPAIDQTIDVVKVMRVRAQAHQRYDIIACPMKSRVDEIERRLGISNANTQEVSR